MSDFDDSNTFEDMCKAISAHWKEYHDILVTPEQIFNYSPNGELFMIFEWYEHVKQHNTEGSEKSGKFSPGI